MLPSSIPSRKDKLMVQHSTVVMWLALSPGPGFKSGVELVCSLCALQLLPTVQKHALVRFIYDSALTVVSISDCLAFCVSSARNCRLVQGVPHLSVTNRQIDFSSL